MEFFAPSKAGEAELLEKRSRFIGRVFPIADENEAKQVIERVRTQFHDARHNPWCYLLPDGSGRASDDGEPSGTSGPPMLELLRHENIRGAAVVVTRYFGGVLLGPGGLIRAYTSAAKAALESTSPVLMVTKTRVITSASYAHAPKIRHEVTACGGIEERAEYAEDVLISALFSAEDAERFCKIVTEITAGGVSPVISGEALVTACNNVNEVM